MSGLPNEFATDCTNHYAGSYSDIGIMHRNKAFHNTALRKCEGETQIFDRGLHADDFPDHWSLIADKGYQVALELIRAITPHKRSEILGFSGEAFNRKLSSDRIIVEMFFGRLRSLRGVIGSTFRWSEGNYDPILNFAWR